MRKVMIELFMSKIGKIVYGYMENPDNWKVFDGKGTEGIITHIPSKTNFWVGGGFLFFDGINMKFETFKVFNLIDKIVIWNRYVKVIKYHKLQYNDIEDINIFIEKITGERNELGRI